MSRNRSFFQLLFKFRIRKKEVKCDANQRSFVYLKCFIINKLSLVSYFVPKKRQGTFDFDINFSLLCHSFFVFCMSLVGN